MTIIDARISTALPGHPKTKKLIRRIGEAGAWKLVCLFLWAAANRPDGDLSGMTAEDLELAIDWTGEPDAFVRALIEVRFLEGVDGTYRIHDWQDWNPWAAGSEDRAEASRWAALCRRYGKEGAAIRMPEYAERMRPAKDKPAGRSDPPAPRSEPQNDGEPPAEIRTAPSPIPTPTPEELPTTSGADAPDDGQRELPIDPPSDLPPPPASAKAADPIWHTGLAFLVRKGIPEKQAREFLGKLKREAGDIDTAAILASAEIEDITEPIPWLAAAATNARDRRKGGRNATNQSNAGLVQRAAERAQRIADERGLSLE